MSEETNRQCGRLPHGCEPDQLAMLRVDVGLDRRRMRTAPMDLALDAGVMLRQPGGRSRARVLRRLAPPPLRRAAPQAGTASARAHQSGAHAGIAQPAFATSRTCSTPKPRRAASGQKSSAVAHRSIASRWIRRSDCGPGLTVMRARPVRSVRMHRARSSA